MPRKKAIEPEVLETMDEVTTDPVVDEIQELPASEEQNQNTELKLDEESNTLEQLNSDESLTETPANDEAEKSLEEKTDETPSEPQEHLNLGVLKLNRDEETQPEINEKAFVWNELSNANRSKRMVTVTITGLESTQLAGNVVVGTYKGQRIIIPTSEMMINLAEDKKYNDGSINERLARICNTMLGAEIDVIIKGMDKKASSIVASRKEAMLKKRERFYLTPLSDGLPQVREGRIVEGRIIAVTPMVARIELFGVEVSMSAAQLSWDWISDVSERYYVGERINVLIEKLEGDNIDNLRVTPDVKSITPNTSAENLEKCTVQGRYIGEVTNIRNGIAYLRLLNGVNAIAHTNYDKRNPGKGDLVSFVITRINHDYGNVSGIITRIIKQFI